MNSTVLQRLSSKATLYPEKSEKLPELGLMQLPSHYEKVSRISNGSYTSVFIVRDRGKDENSQSERNFEEGPLLAAKFMKDKTEFGNSEVDILRQLQGSDHIPKLVEDFHHDYQTILITEYLAGAINIYIS